MALAVGAVVLGAAGFMTIVYLGFLSWAQDWNYATSQLVRDRAYVVPIIIAFGLQSSLYSVIRFGLFRPVTTGTHPGAMVGANGATSTTSMVIPNTSPVTPPRTPRPSPPAQMLPEKGEHPGKCG